MPNVEIILKTIDQASPNVKKVKEEFKSLVPGLESASKGVGNFISANAALIGTVTAVAVAASKAYNEFQNYAGQVRDLAAVSGTGAVEASKLLQVLDDYQLTAQDVTAATRFMTKAGLTPTIDTLAKLSDQYNAINDPMAKNEFILKNLGKGGLQWVNVLKQGGDALRAQSDEVSKSLILTDEQIKKAEQARLAVDAWSDAWQGFKISVGSAIGGIIAANDQASKMRDTFFELNNIQQTGRGSAAKYKDEITAFTAQMERGKAATEFYSKMQSDLTGTMEAAGPTIEQMTTRNQGLLGVIENLQSETDNYNSKNADLLAKLKELTTEQENTSTWSTKYGELTAQIDTTKGAISALAEEHAAAGKKIAFSLIQQKMAMDGLTDSEFQSLLKLGEQWGIYDTSVVTAAIAMDGAASRMVDSLSGPKQSLLDINDKIKNLKKLSEQEITISVTANVHTVGGLPAGVTVAGGGSGTGNACFTGDILVTLADGSTKPIMDIQVGDALLSWDTEKQQPVISYVTEVIRHAAHEGGRLLLINGHIKVTEEHMLFDGENWKPAGWFVPGNVLVGLDGSLVKVQSVREIIKDAPTYNLEVDHNAHNYFANGILAHNATTGKWTGGQLGGQWTWVGDMPGGRPGPYSELVSPSGRVYNAKESRMIAQSGILNDVNFMAQGGDVFTGSSKPAKKSAISSRPSAKAGRVGSRPASVANAAESPNPQSNNSVVNSQMQQQMQQQQQAIAATMENTSTLAEILSVLKSDNPRAIGKAVGAQLAKFS